MSKKWDFDWHSAVLACIAITAMTMLFYILSPLFKQTLPPIPKINGLTIENAYYDENCVVIVMFSDGTYDRIPTDSKLVEPDLRCYQSKWVSISANKKYLLFEGSDWHSEDAVGYYPGNYLGVYFVSHRQTAIWPFGSAKVSKATIDKDNFAVFQAVYEEQKPIQFTKLSLPFIDAHFEATVNPNTHEIKLIEGVIER